jgi:glycosyltransferase involved in cell wall biosynthesis
LRVAFDSRGGDDPRGVGRYVRSLLQALRETAGEHDVRETHRPRGADVYHSPWIDGATLRTRVPQIVTVHDLVPLKRREEYLRTGIRFRLRYLTVQRADHVIVPTEAVAADAAELLEIPREQITVIGEAPVAAMRPRSPEEVADVRDRYALPEQYLVWVGGLAHPDPRKRVAQLVQTPRALPLVLVGPAGEWAHDLAADDDGVTLTGHVSDDELAAIYTGARALVFPSDDEGFGLPTVEALACGTPVVACDVPALREVLGDRATFVAQDDLAGLLRSGAAIDRPAPAAPAFTWADAARATWRVYEAVAAGRG